MKMMLKIMNQLLNNIKVMMKKLKKINKYLMEQYDLSIIIN